MKHRFKTFLVLFAIGAIAFALSFAKVGKAEWWLRLGGVLFVVLAVVALFIKEKAPEPVNEEYLYKVKDSFMSEPERELYATLCRICGSAYCVFPQVALASVVDKVNFGSYRNELFRVVDFVLCDKKRLRPVLVVELNDASHNRDERKRRDEKVKCILQRAGLPLLALTFEEAFDERTLRKKLNSAF